MDELLDKYEEKFGECFPLMLTMGMSEEEIKYIIKVCLDNDYPYFVESDADY